MVAHQDDLARVRRFDRPVWLIKGAGSSSYYHQIIEALAANFPKAQVSEKPAGHAPHVVSMDWFLEELVRFQGQGASTAP